jgi:hypothetical protein
MEQVHFSVAELVFCSILWLRKETTSKTFAGPGLNLRKMIQSDGLTGKPLGGRQWRPSSIQ